MTDLTARLRDDQGDCNCYCYTIYTDPERPWAAMPAHNTDFWEYKKPLPF